MTAIAGYSRISITLEESTSIAAQQQIIDHRAGEYPDPKVVHFTDDGFSGSKDIERPAYNQMIEGIKAGKFDVLLCKSLDRLGRRLLAFTSLVELCNQHNCVVVAIDDHLDSGSAQGILMLQLLSVFAQFEANVMAARQATGQAY